MRDEMWECANAAREIARRRLLWTGKVYTIHTDFFGFKSAWSEPKKRGMLMVSIVR